MKTKPQHLLTALCALSLSSAALQAGTPAAIPADQIGAAAQAAYQGDGIALKPSANGAEVSVIFQKLAGEITTGGLWLESTETADKPERFRVRAAALGGSLSLPAGGRGESGGGAGSGPLHPARPD